MAALQEILKEILRLKKNWKQMEIKARKQGRALGVGNRFLFIGILKVNYLKQE